MHAQKKFCTRDALASSLYLTDRERSEAAYHAEDPRFVVLIISGVFRVFHETGHRGTGLPRGRPRTSEEVRSAAAQVHDRVETVSELESNVVSREVTVVLQPCAGCVGVVLGVHVEPLRPHLLENRPGENRAHTP